ncbi:124aa long hypothetical protein [Pyrococcus horikoshii OT3]|uniref:Uncharacterized protein n=1 Tax=Pyrococcus horikoshii (strain ATCC 700860 / DSM 12428 / JCM 9974 / NBRC 100139 / OT-3) TaxID=70601 RepID=O57846_PYRHO|nr:124aa long hypothetical protein [Pyrococcus horikoshii OT3]
MGVTYVGYQHIHHSAEIAVSSLLLLASRRSLRVKIPTIFPSSSIRICFILCSAIFLKTSPSGVFTFAVIKFLVIILSTGISYGSPGTITLLIMSLFVKKPTTFPSSFITTKEPTSNSIINLEAS